MKQNMLMHKDSALPASRHNGEIATHSPSSDAPKANRIDQLPLQSKKAPVEYDGIAAGYKASKRLPFRKHLEFNTISYLLDDIRGKSVLDLACGEGIYARRLRDLGAARVTGVDLSEKMIKLALEEESKQPKGLDFIQGDAGKVGKIGDFDIVLASYLLNYAKTPEVLLSFLRTAKMNLGDSGKMVGVNNNPFNDVGHFSDYRQYGFTKSLDKSGPIKEGDAIAYRFFDDEGGEITFNNFHLTATTYENAFAEAGFDHFEWVPMRLSKASGEIFPKHYWDALMANCPIIGFIAY